ncbi:MAG: CYTH domain-containing protein [bacterium]|nr:CYTH domain-containing protein [bacterium]
MIEYEVKFLDINPESIQQKLETIGANKLGEYFYRSRVFDYSDWRLDREHSWLRLRDEDGRTTLSFKKRLGVRGSDGKSNDAGMEEIEIIVSDFDSAASLIQALGFVEKHFVEKKRRRWQKNGVEFDIDIYPEIPPFLEIEAHDWEQIDTAIRWLGLNPSDKKIFSANQVFALYGFDVKQYIRIAFDGLIKRK